MSLSYHIALSGVRAAEYLITTASNNIANANNPSYARQRVDLSSSNYVSRGGGIMNQVGQGVDVNYIQRIIDQTTTKQVRAELSRKTNVESVEEILKTVEVIFNEVGASSISTLTQNLFNAFEEASKYPEQNSYRVSALSAAEVLSNKIKEVAFNLHSITDDIDSRIEVEMTKVNELIREIAKTNDKILKSGTDSPNSLLDQRDGLIDELSKYVDVKTIQGTNPGELSIVIGNSTVVSNANYALVDSKFDQDSKSWVLGVDNIELAISGGSIKGLLDSKNILLPSYTGKLNEFTKALASRLNEVHQSGFGLDGTTGEPLFITTDALTIELNPELIGSPEKLALSSEEGVYGNSAIATALSEILFENIISNQTLQGYYQEFSVGMASDLSNISHQVDVHRNIHNELEGYRQSVQGVNIDEELMAINSYQQYYQANIKTMQVIDSTLDTLLSII